MEIQRRIATEQVVAEIDGVNTVVAEPGQPVPLAYDDLVPADKATPIDVEASTRSTADRRAAAAALSSPSGSGPEQLTGDALKQRAADLDIEGRSQMTADELRAAIADAESGE